MLQWRNRHLDFSSVTALTESLGKAPTMPGLTRTVRGDDAAALEFLVRDPQILDQASGEEAVHALWDVCQIPDYRNITGGDHATLLGKVFGFLRSDAGTIPTDWFEKQVSYADVSDGDIDTLSNRIAHIRTWTYIANRSDWLEDPVGWQQRTRAVEDKLSDALHEQLTQRFIDRRTSVLMKRMREKEKLMAAVSEEGVIMVEGEFVGHLKGFHFVPDADADGSHGRTLRSASMKAVAAEISAKAKRFAQAPDPDLDLTLSGVLRWEGANIARLSAGDHMLKPRVQLVADDQLTGSDRDAVQERAERWVEARLKTNLEPLFALDAAGDIDGLARGLAFRLVEALGVLPRDEVAADVKLLDQPTRATLRKYGVRFGAFSIYLPVLLKPAATRLKLTLWGLQRQAADGFDMETLPEPPQQGLTSAKPDAGAPAGFYQVVGFRNCGARVVRIDMLERLSDLIRPLVFWKPAQDGETRPEGSVEGGGFTVTPDMMSLVGCSGDEFSAILRAVGFRSEVRKRPAARPAAAATEAAADSPGRGDTAEDGSAPEPGQGSEQQTPDTQPNEAPAGAAQTATAEASSAAAADGELPEAAAPAAEPDQIEVWKPKPAKRREHGGKNRSAAPHGRKRDKSPTDKPPQTRKRSHGAKRRASKPAPPPKDSPFAALSALKATLEEKQRTDPK